MELSRYIHLNPVRVRRCEGLSLDEKRNVLRNYTWSSFAAHIGLAEKPDFLDISPVLFPVRKTESEKMKRYRDKRRSPERQARKLAIYLCCRYCTSHTSLTDIARMFGITLSGLTRTRDRAADSLKESPEPRGPQRAAGA